MDYQFLSQTMLFSGESPEEIKEMSPVTEEMKKVKETRDRLIQDVITVRSSIMPENACIRWDWCSPEMFRLKVMMSGEITVY